MATSHYVVGVLLFTFSILVAGESDIKPAEPEPLEQHIEAKEDNAPRAGVSVNTVIAIAIGIPLLMCVPIVAVALGSDEQEAGDRKKSDEIVEDEDVFKDYPDLSDLSKKLKEYREKLGRPPLKERQADAHEYAEDVEENFFRAVDLLDNRIKEVEELEKKKREEEEEKSAKKSKPSKRGTFQSKYVQHIVPKGTPLPAWTKKEYPDTHECPKEEHVSDEEVDDKEEGYKEDAKVSEESSSSGDDSDDILNTPEGCIRARNILIQNMNEELDRLGYPNPKNFEPSYVQEVVSIADLIDVSKVDDDASKKFTERNVSERKSSTRPKSNLTMSNVTSGTKDTKKPESKPTKALKLKPKTPPPKPKPQPEEEIETVYMSEESIDEMLANMKDDLKEILLDKIREAANQDPDKREEYVGNCLSDLINELVAQTVICTKKVSKCK